MDVGWRCVIKLKIKDKVQISFGNPKWFCCDLILKLRIQNSFIYFFLKLRLNFVRNLFSLIIIKEFNPFNKFLIPAFTVKSIRHAIKSLTIIITA